MSFATARRIPPALGQESVWDYPRPPRVENTSEHIEAIISGVKRVANYYTIEVNGKQAENVAWYYSKPTGPEFSSIKDHVAIYVGPMDECYVDGERVVPQPGQFYGGWITKDMVEPFKVLSLNAFPCDALYKDDHRMKIIQGVESNKIVQHDFATDNRAFELITGKGFVNFTQTVLSVGQDIVKSRSINASDLLPHPTTVSRNIDRLFISRKSQLISLCQNIKSYAIVVDFWTESHTGVSFCGISLHYLNDELQLQAFILGCYPYDRDNQTSTQIRQFVDSKLMEYNLSLNNNKFVVTDNENKMKSSFKDSCTRIGCSIHYMNKQLEHCFITNTIEKMPVNCDLAQEMFGYIRKIVSHMRRTHKQTKLPRKLQSYSDTRFNGAFYTMNMFLMVFDDLAGVLDRTFLADYMLIDKDLLEQYLLNRYIINSDDHDGIRQIKTFLGSRLQDVWVLQDIHYITTFLHPSFKNFDVNSILQERALNLVKSEIFKRQPSTSSTPCPSVDKTTIITPELNSQHKSLTNVLSKCFDLPKSDLRLSTTPDHEVDEYMSMNVQMKEGDDILLFWLAHKSRFPILFSIVQDYYAVPAANTTIERLFSASKNTVTDKRTSLGTEKINKLLFLQKNLLSLETFDKKILNEVDTKRKMSVHDETCLTTSLHKQEQLRTSTSAKKLKKDEQDDIFICDEDYEDYEDNENDKF
ncbi:unnamed protein product [Rotaria socialis]|uniref:Uncharacterized protein n=2 Tax=Rotaria socialis TaxID=392032 RepID=A0A817TTL9_9BILA|nr:unnamed protein product [Rotaria socialis]